MTENDVDKNASLNKIAFSPGKLAVKLVQKCKFYFSSDISFILFMFGLLFLLQNFLSKDFKVNYFTHVRKKNIEQVFHWNVVTTIFFNLT